MKQRFIQEQPVVRAKTFNGNLESMKRQKRVLHKLNGNTSITQMVQMINFPKRFRLI
jgi:hypothetical protein